MNLDVVKRKYRAALGVGVLIAGVGVVAVLARSPSGDGPRTEQANPVGAADQSGRKKLGPDGQQATSGYSYVLSDTPGVEVALRTLPDAGNASGAPGVTARLADRTLVMMRCWIDTYAPGGVGSPRWFYVEVGSGSVHAGKRGFVWSDFVWDQILVGKCPTSVAPPLRELRDSKVTLSKGARSGAGFYYVIRFDSFPPNWVAHVACSDTGQAAPFKEFTMTAGPAGTAVEQRSCLSTSSGQHWVLVDYLVPSNTAWWDAPAQPGNGGGQSPPGGGGSGTGQPADPPKPTLWNFAVSTGAPRTASVSFNVGWQAGRDPVTCHFFIDGVESFTAQCGTSSSKQFTGLSPGEHTFYATVTDRFGVSSVRSPVLTRTVAADSPPPPKPTATNLVVVIYGGGHVGVAFDVGWQTGRDPVTCHFFIDGIESFTAQCGTHSSKQFYGISPGQHSFYATVSDQFGVYSDPTATIVRQVT